MTRVFGMRLFHPDLWEMLFKFSLDLIVVFALIRMIYYPVSYTHLTLPTNREV